ncbi:hypothetical protein M8J76_002521 [Diaphorina citri]|nr:hypothetical protein M8J76_002521 [Diaphorina citri]KAI5721693.1 hypothetical protein M8J77_024308 [Diaphorina citri]
MAGQTINDRLLAAKHSLAGQGLAKAVCKATTEELIGPKKKHLDYLLHCTNEANVSIPDLATLLIERTQNSSSVVVFKALITIHHLMCYGNERFTQYLASSNCSLQLGNFLDKSGIHGYDMTPFIHRYSRYINEKSLSYRTVAFDFCKVKRGKEDGLLRTMPANKLLKSLPVLQSQIDALLEFDCNNSDLRNGVINGAFMLLFRDLIRLFAGYNDSIINLLEKYFDMNKKQCKEALDLYKKFLIRMDRVAEFLKVAENVGIDKGDIPDLTKAPSSLLEALEQHLATLEGKKSAAGTPTQASHRNDVKSGVNSFSTTSSAFSAVSGADLEESLKKQALAEEEAILNQYKAKVSSPTSSMPSNAASTNPFLASPTQPIVDLFGSAPASVEPVQTSKPSDDLLQLGNPFVDDFTGAAAPGSQPPVNNAWTSNGFNMNTTSVQQDSFVSDKAFSSVFGDLDPSKTMPPPSTVPGALGSAPTPPAPKSKVITGDLDSSLASLADNLIIDKSAQPSGKGNMQWNSPVKTATGAAGWTPQPMAATTGANYRPMGQSMTPFYTDNAFPAQPVGAPRMPMMPSSGGTPLMGSPRQVPSGQPPVASTQLDPFGSL